MHANQHKTFCGYFEVFCLWSISVHQTVCMKTIDPNDWSLHITSTQNELTRNETFFSIVEKQVIPAKDKNRWNYYIETWN